MTDAWQTTVNTHEVGTARRLQHARPAAPDLGNAVVGAGDEVLAKGVNGDHVCSVQVASQRALVAEEATPPFEVDMFATYMVRAAKRLVLCFRDTQPTFSGAQSRRLSEGMAHLQVA